MNEFGSYYECQADPSYTYSMAVVHGDPYAIHDQKLAWGFCLLSNCNKSALLPLEQFIKNSINYVFEGAKDLKVEFIIPEEDLQDERVDRLNILLVLCSLVGLSLCLGVFGMVVEFTRVGNVKLSHEETNFANIDIPIIQEGNTAEQLNQILIVKDELLRNSKSLWATIVLCFSLTRNLRHLFYKFKLQPERVRHRNAMYFVNVLGFAWFNLYAALYLGIKVFPENVWRFPEDLNHWTYMLNHGGQLFGMNMMYFATGYIMAVNFFNFTNYLPSDFFQPINYLCCRPR